MSRNLAYVIGALLVTAGLVIMLADLAYMETTSSQYGVPFWQETQGFASGFVSFIVGCGLIIRKWRLERRSR